MSAPGRRRALVVAAWVVLAVATAMLTLGYPWDDVVRYKIDLDVYRLGGRVLLDGGHLYGPLPPVADGELLPFTYPPMSALVFSSLALVGMVTATVVHGLTTTACLYYVVWVTLDQLRRHHPRPPAWPMVHLTAGITGLAMFLGPVRTTFEYGQVNVYLMALVVADVMLGRGRWWRGSLIGLAAALKLTPAVFGLYYLLRRDWRGALGCVVWGLGFTALAWCVSPADSVEYWTHTLGDPGRIGPLESASNQGINGFLHRIGVGGAWEPVLWIGGSLVVLALVVVVARRLLDHDRPLAALCTVAFVGLYGSPVSWSHHWVWAVPLSILLIGGGLRARADRATAGGGATGRPELWAGVVGVVLMGVDPQFRFHYGHGLELAWPWWKQVLVASYLWWGLAVLAVFARETRPEAPAGVDDEFSEEPGLVSGSRREGPVDGSGELSTGG